MCFLDICSGSFFTKATLFCLLLFGKSGVFVCHIFLLVRLFFAEVRNSMFTDIIANLMINNYKSLCLIGNFHLFEPFHIV